MLDAHLTSVQSARQSEAKLRLCHFTVLFDDLINEFFSNSAANHNEGQRLQLCLAVSYSS